MIAHIHDDFELPKKISTYFQLDLFYAMKLPAPYWYVFL